MTSPIYQLKARGGILVTWRKGVFGTVDLWRVHRHAVSVQLSAGDDLNWWLAGFYGPHQDSEKAAFLEELR